MPVAEDPPTEKKHSSSSYRDELAHYKAQYEQLEAELADFQVSSRELETELEKDIEASEKRERQLKEKVDALRYEVDEWKVWHQNERKHLKIIAIVGRRNSFVLADQIQAIEDGRQFGAKHLAEGDHLSS